MPAATTFSVLHLLLTIYQANLFCRELCSSVSPFLLTLQQHLFIWLPWFSSQTQTYRNGTAGIHLDVCRTKDHGNKHSFP